jgi:dinuclear metal center YbgI/SA1388 family protein
VTTLADCLAVLDGAYDPGWAEDWDAVGLVCGDPDQQVTRVHVAVDPVRSVAQEALHAGAQLLLTHHPLWLRGVHAVSADSIVNDLIRAGCALLAAHTNADVARPGVNDALLSALGLGPGEVLLGATQELDALTVHVPAEARAALHAALAEAGAGRLGDYDRCGFWTTGTGTFRPLAGAAPRIGSVGVEQSVVEDRLELVVPRSARGPVLAALRAQHPYEEPSFALWPLQVPADRGLGRVVEVPEPTTVAALADHVARCLPSTVGGVRWSRDAPVHRVAVCGGSGSELTSAARAAGADVLITADTRHHGALDAVLPIIDVSHWASEWPWCEQAAALLRRELGVTVGVSRIVTDPWTGHVGGTP